VRGVQPDPTDEAIRRVPSQAIEDLVMGALGRLAHTKTPQLGVLLARAEIHPTNVQLIIQRAACLRRPSDRDDELRQLQGRLEPGERLASIADDEDRVRLILPCRLKFSSGRIRVTDPAGKPLVHTAQPDETLISALRAAHTTLADLSGSAIGSPELAVFSTAPPNPYVRSLMRMAFLAPDIQDQILQGRHPAGLNRQRLVLGEIPLAWVDQRRLFESG
jgi:site-specific DNA recombinase